MIRKRKIEEQSQRNSGVERIHFDSETGNVEIEHHSGQLTVSGKVRGDLTLRGNININRLTTGGWLNQIS